MPNNNNTDSYNTFSPSESNSGNNAIFSSCLEEKLIKILLKYLYGIKLTDTTTNLIGLNAELSTGETTIIQSSDINNSDQNSDVIKKINSIRHIYKFSLIASTLAFLTLTAGGLAAGATYVLFVHPKTGKQNDNLPSNLPSSSSSASSFPKPSSSSSPNASLFQKPSSSSSPSASLSPAPSLSSSPSASLFPKPPLSSSPSASPSSAPGSTKWPEGVIALTFVVDPHGYFELAYTSIIDADCIVSPEDLRKTFCPSNLASGTTQYYQLSDDGVIEITANPFVGEADPRDPIILKNDQNTFKIINPERSSGWISDPLPNSPQTVTSYADIVPGSQLAKYGSQTAKGVLSVGSIAAGFFANQTASETSPNFAGEVSSSFLTDIPALIVGIASSAFLVLGLVYWLYNQASKIDQSREESLESQESLPRFSS